MGPTVPVPEEEASVEFADMSTMVSERTTGDVVELPDEAMDHDDEELVDAGGCGVVAAGALLLAPSVVASDAAVTLNK